MDPRCIAIGKLYCNLGSVVGLENCIARQEFVLQLGLWARKLYCNTENCIAMRLASRLGKCIAIGKNCIARLCSG